MLLATKSLRTSYLVIASFDFSFQFTYLHQDLVHVKSIMLSGQGIYSCERNVDDAPVQFSFTQVGRLYRGHHNERQGLPICGRVAEGARPMRDKRRIQAPRSGLSDGTEPGCRNLYDLVFAPCAPFPRPYLAVHKSLNGQPDMCLSGTSAIANYSRATVS